MGCLLSLHSSSFYPREIPNLLSGFNPKTSSLLMDPGKTSDSFSTQHSRQSLTTDLSWHMKQNFFSKRVILACWLLLREIIATAG